MPFPMKVQPIDSSTFKESIKNDTTLKPVLKSRLKRFFDRPFPSVLRISSEKPSAGGGAGAAVAADEFEPSSVCLDKMVQNFIEENNEKPKIGRKCNCFNGKNNDSSDDEFAYGFFDSVTNDSFDTLKSLIPCASVAERNLLADTSKIVEKNRCCKPKDDLRKIVAEELLALGYKASICNSKWEKTSSIPAGEYEFIYVIVEGERVIIDVDFRSEFEIARSTGSYKAVLQLLPFVFVGKADRIQQIVSIVSEAARQSLKKKDMHIAPWRKPEYMISKWIGPYTSVTPRAAVDGVSEPVAIDKFNDKTLPLDYKSEKKSLLLISSPSEKVSGEEVKLPLMMTWQSPEIKPKSCDRGNKVVTGSASLLREKP